jgi:membrane protein YdbS with pleckstrin-like domain
MNKINLKEKIEVLNMHRITFAVVLFILLIVIASILLLVWWPVKPSLAEITNSWVALIMVYLVLSILLFEKPIYKFFLNIFENCKRKTLDGDFSMLIPIWSCTQNMFYSGFINPNW